MDVLLQRRAADFSARLAPVALFAGGASVLAATIYLAGWQPTFRHSPVWVSSSLLATAAGLFLICAGVRVRREAARRRSFAAIHLRGTLRRMAVGMALAALLAVVLADRNGAPGVVLAGFAVWCCAMAAAWIAPVNSRGTFYQLSRRRWLRHSAAAASWLLLSFAATELLLRVTAGGGFTSPGLKPLHTASLLPPLVNSTTESLPKTRFVSHSTSLQPNIPQTTIALAAFSDSLLDFAPLVARHIQAELPRAMITQLTSTSSAADSPGRYAQLRKFVAAEKPSLLLLMVAVDRDLLVATKRQAWGFDSLRTVQATKHLLGQANDDQAAIGPSLAIHDDQQQFLAASVSGLRVCRVPLTDETLSQWQTTFAHLERLADACRQHGTTLGLVIAPGEFQVNRLSLEAVCRRTGCQAHHIDLELPQRRLTAFAAQHNLATIDLLPVLRGNKSLSFVRNSARWNATGNTAAAEAVSQFVRARFAVKLAATGN